MLEWQAKVFGSWQRHTEGLCGVVTSVSDPSHFDVQRSFGERGSFATPSSLLLPAIPQSLNISEIKKRKRRAELESS